MEEKIRKYQVPPEEAPEPSPQITPEMVRTALKTLESKGMVHYAEGAAYVPTEKGWKLLMEIKPVNEEIIAYGHSNITATDVNEFRIVKSSEIKKDANSVIAVKANKACKDLNKEFKDALKEAKKVEIVLEADGVKDRIVAYGSPALKLTSAEEIVLRKNDFIDNRTLAILSNKSANEIKQELIEKLRKSETELKITLEIK